MEESNRIMLGKFTNVDVFQTVLGYIGEEILQECALARLPRACNGDNREVLGGLSKDAFHCAVEV